MHYTTVAQLEVGARSLRLNEVAAQLAEAEQLASDYYTRQRIERLRDK